MASYSIVEDLDIIEHIRSGKISDFIDPLLDALLFQAAEERFCHGIPTITASTHAGLQIMGPAEPVPVVTAILRALVRMNQDLVSRMASPHRHQ